MLFLSLSLHHSAQGEIFPRANIPPSVTAPTQSSPPLPAFAWTDGGVGPGCGTDGQRDGACSTRGAACTAREVLCSGQCHANPGKLGWGFVLRAGSRWWRCGQRGDRPIPAAGAAVQSRGQRSKHIHLRDPVEARLLPGTDMAAVPRVLGTGNCGGRRQRERVKAGKWPQVRQKCGVSTRESGWSPEPPAEGQTRTESPAHLGCASHLSPTAQKCRNAACPWSHRDPVGTGQGCSQFKRQSRSRAGACPWSGALFHHGKASLCSQIPIPARKQGNAPGTQSACSGGITGGRGGTRTLTQPWSSLGRQLSLQCLLFLN